MSLALLLTGLLFFTSHIASTHAAADSTCFFPNRDVHDLGKPCDPDASNSACCEATHTCLSNGLCFDTHFNHVIRGSCTDSSWDDASCPQYCVNNDPTQSGANGDLRQCDNDNNDWVCGMDSSNCTDTFTVAFGFVDDMRNSSVNNILADGSVVNGTAATSTVMVTVTATATASAGTSFGTPAGSSSSSTLAAGLGAGLGVGVPLLIALTTALFFLQKTRKENSALKSQGAQAPQYATTHQDFPKAPAFGNTGHPGGMQELGATTPSAPVYEAPGGR